MENNVVRFPGLNRYESIWSGSDRKGAIVSAEINFAYVSHTGYWRHNNEDNFWCLGNFLPQLHNGTDDVISGKDSGLENDFFAVFDGMGGERRGEAASYIAADTFGKCLDEYIQTGMTHRAILYDACYTMNDEICAYAREHKIRAMGTTAAIMEFAGGSAYLCNLGDSRIYRLRGEKLTQLSQDHVASGYFGRKAPLTQCLGIEPTEMILEPYIRRCELRPGDKFIACSDGLTDMVSDREIHEVMDKNDSPENCVQELLAKALKNGGRDNVTIAVCEVKGECKKEAKITV